MVCPYLTYESSDEEHSFEHERPYCSVAEEFVQPMRADICTEAGDLSPESHCEIYREAENID